MLYLCTRFLCLLVFVMILNPNCKINLGLRVVRKRPDGYHDLETIFVPIYGLFDELEVVKAVSRQPSAISFQQEGIAVDCPEEDNLIIKCYRQMAAKYAQIGPVSIRFKKNIPFGAGLGGGSSDAAHMAIALNELFGLGLTKEQLAKEVRSLGADCPFFIYNTPCYAEGIGDELTPIDLDLKGTRIIMIKPNEGVSTKEAYSGITRHPEVSGQIKSVFCQAKNEVNRALAAKKPVCILSGENRKALIVPLGKEAGLLVNDFEASVFPKHPVIAEIKKRLLDAGAYYASMSGSGSTVFGFFKDDPEGGTDARLTLLKEEFASMILLDDTFSEWKA